MKNRVEGHSHLYKDNETGVINNRSSIERDRYRLAKKQALSQVEQKAELDEMRDDINEIKALLKQMLNQ